MNFKRLILIAIIGAGIGWMLVPQPASAAPKAQACEVTNATLTAGKASFTVPEGCSQTVTLASYSTPTAAFDPKRAGEQKLTGFKTAELTAGDYSWTVELSPCLYQLDLALGQPIKDLGKELYGERLVKSATGGQPCTTTTTALVTTTTAIPDDTQRGEDYNLPTEAPQGLVQTPEIAQPIVLTNVQPEALATTGSPSKHLIALGLGLLTIGGLLLWGRIQYVNFTEGKKARFEE